MLNFGQKKNSILAFAVGRDRARENLSLKTLDRVKK